MKKTIITFVIAGAFFTHLNNFGMFKCIIQRTHQSKRYHTKRSFFNLPNNNIFNASYTCNGLLEDLYDRNNNTIADLKKCIKALEDQNDIAVAHVYHAEPLNMDQLKSLEKQLQEKLTPTTTQMLKHLKTELLKK